MTERGSLNIRTRVASQPATMKAYIIYAAAVLVLARAKRMCGTTPAIAWVYWKSRVGE